MHTFLICNTPFYHINIYSVPLGFCIAEINANQAKLSNICLQFFEITRFSVDLGQDLSYDVITTLSEPKLSLICVLRTGVQLKVTSEHYCKFESFSEEKKKSTKNLEISSQILEMGGGTTKSNIFGCNNPPKKLCEILYRLYYPLNFPLKVFAIHLKKEQIKYLHLHVH